MDKKIIFGVIALIVVTISLLLIVPDNSEHTPETLPWKFTHPTPDTTRVLGITLGETTLGEVERIFKYQAALEVSLFKPNDKNMSVEAFFEEVNFNGLKAKILLNVSIAPDVLEGMYKRGLRMNSTPSGKRITLTPDDLALVSKSPVASMIYLPNLRIEEAILAKRFGEPAQRIRESETGVIHWLYPQDGLDVVLGGEEKPLMQYVPPKDFELLRAPLLVHGKIIAKQ